MVRFVGLDVHKRLVQACLLDDQGQVLARQRFDLSREQLLRFAQTHLQPNDRVVVEASTNTWAVVDVLRPFVAAVVVSNPLQTKAIAAAKIKTDKVDAYVLAQLLRCDFLPRVWEPDPATQELRRLVSRRAGLVAQRTAVKNRLHAVLAMRLLVPPVEHLFSSAGLAWLRTCTLDDEGRCLLDSDLRLLEAIEAELASLDALVIPKAYADDRAKLLMTLPGVDYTVAQTLLAALGAVGRFPSADQAASYLGLSPCTKQSADRCHHGPITKRGNGHARWMLVQAAQHVGKHPGPLGVFFRRLAHKKNRNVAVVACARKLVVIAWHMLTNNQPYRYAQPRATETKLQRLRVKATGQRRKSGPRPGAAAAPKAAAGLRTRTIKPLAQVCRDEGLPEPGTPPAGEARTVTDSGSAAYVASLAAAGVRKTRPRQPAPEA
jgi:transposase